MPRPSRIGPPTRKSRDIKGSTYWHFVNVPIWASRYDPRDCRPQGCVISKIAEFKATLLDPSAPLSRRRMALRFLVHLVQDVHQPMHVETVFEEADPRSSPRQRTPQQGKAVPAGR